MTKIYIIAGEASGDFIGSKLMASLKLLIQDRAHISTKNRSEDDLNHVGKQDLEIIDWVKALAGVSPKETIAKDNELIFCGVGGSLMEAEGLSSLFPVGEINLMGFVEIIPHISRIRRLIKKTVNNIKEESPDLLITIDSPGFNYRVAKKIRASIPNLKIIHIVAPSVWAYAPKRAIKYAKVYDYLLAILPFEPPYFEKVNLPCEFIGHPILEQNFYQDKNALRQEFGYRNTTKVICITPGSRVAEINRHMPVFIESLKHVLAAYEDLEVIVALSDAKYEDLIDKYFKGTKLKYSYASDRLKAFAVADVALAKSGTNTLEIAASGTPIVVAYKLNPITFNFLRLYIKIKFASIINIIANHEIIPEFLQSRCTPKPIADQLIKLLSEDGSATAQVLDSKYVLDQLAAPEGRKPSETAAKLIVERFFS